MKEKQAGNLSVLLVKPWQGEVSAVGVMFFLLHV